VDHLPVVLEEPDVAPEEQVIALCAEAHFVEGPPLFQRVVGLKELQFPSQRGDQGLYGLRGRFRAVT
jgi:hypothetical protein